jgi:hypothetical protein
LTLFPHGTRLPRSTRMVHSGSPRIACMRMGRRRKAADCLSSRPEGLISRAFCQARSQRGGRFYQLRERFGHQRHKPRRFLRLTIHWIAQLPPHAGCAGRASGPPARPIALRNDEQPVRSTGRTSDLRCTRHLRSALCCRSTRGFQYKNRLQSAGYRVDRLGQLVAGVIGVADDVLVAATAVALSRAGRPWDISFGGMERVFQQSAIRLTKT